MSETARLFGRGISFPPRVGADGRIVWSEGVDNVRESIRVILTTELRERVMRPDFGAGLGEVLFEPNNAATHSQIAQRVERALARWEPRVAVEAVEVSEDPSDPASALVVLRYALVATGARERMSLRVALKP